MTNAACSWIITPFATRIRISDISSYRPSPDRKSVEITWNGETFIHPVSIEVFERAIRAGGGVVIDPDDFKNVPRDPSSMRGSTREQSRNYQWNSD